MTETFGAILREKRVDLRMVLRKFGDVTGISPVTLSKIERNEVAPSKKELTSILAQLNLSQTDADDLRRMGESLTTEELQARLLEEFSGINRARYAMRIAKDMKFTDKEWADIYRSMPKIGAKGELR